VITADDGADGWTGTGEKVSGSALRTAAEVDLLYRGVDALRDAVPRQHQEHGTLEFALFEVSRVLEEAARSTSSGEDVPAGVYRAALAIARHLEHYGAGTDGSMERSTPPTPAPEPGPSR
jgi:hypothetical protein